MDCPKCKTRLVPDTLDGIEVETCPRCHGLWFDNDELRQAKDLADPNLHWLDSEIWKHEERFAVAPASGPCPKCGATMCSLKYDPTEVVIDYCVACHGAWLDKDELHNLVTALKDEIARMPAKEYLVAAIHEAGELLKRPESLASEWKDFTQILKLLNLRVMIEAPGLHRVIASVLGSKGPFG